MPKNIPPNTRLHELYTRPFTLIFSGIESKTHFDLAYSAGVRDFLMAIVHCKKIKPAEMDRRFGNGDCRLMIDSSTFTFHNDIVKNGDKSQYLDKTKYPLAYWEKFIEDYLQWVREHADYITAFVEFDITLVVGTEQVLKWRKQYFEPFEKETGIPCLYMYQPQYNASMWEQMCKKYNYVGFSGEAGMSDKQVMKMLSVAKKHGTAVHGMAYTKVDKLKSGRYPFASADSVSWKSSEMYGVTYIFDGKNFVQFDKTQKHRRKKYKTILIKQGVDWKKIEKDDASENTRMALIAWTKVGKYLSDMFTRTGKAYWLIKGGTSMPKKVLKKKQKVDDEDVSEVSNMEDDDVSSSNGEIRFPPPKSKWEEDTDYNWEEVAESMNINPKCGDESVVLFIIDLLNCLHHHTSRKHGEYLYTLLDKNEEIIDHIFDTYVDGNVTFDEDEDREPPKAVFDYIMKDDDFDVDAGVFNGNSMDKLAKLLEITPKVLDGELNIFQIESEESERPSAPSERDEYAGDEDRASVALIPRDEQGRFLDGNNAHLRRTRSILSHTPKLACDTCYAADSCYYFKPKSVCYYHKELNKFDTRNIEDIFEIHSDLTNMATQRLLLARIFEQFDGGMPDKMVTDLINQVSGMLLAQKQLHGAMKPTNVGGHGDLQISASGQASNSIIATLFGGMGQKKEEPVDVTPPKQKGSTVIDAIFTEVEEDKPKTKKIKKKVKK